MTGNNHECIIGLIYHTDYSELCTLSILRKVIDETKELNEISRKYGYGSWNKEYTMQDYGDRRKSTNLTRFDFCPYCGKKIDWKEIRENG